MPMLFVEWKEAKEFEVLWEGSDEATGITEKYSNRQKK